MGAPDFTGAPGLGGCQTRRSDWRRTDIDFDLKISGEPGAVIHGAVYITANVTLQDLDVTNQIAMTEDCDHASFVEQYTGIIIDIPGNTIEQASERCSLVCLERCLVYQCGGDGVTIYGDGTSNGHRCSCQRGNSRD